MQRAARFAITGLVLICLTKFFDGGSIPLVLSAAPAPDLRSQSASTGWHAIASSPLQSGMALVDRLLRRPRAMFGSPAIPTGFGLRFDGVDDRVTFGKTLATGGDEGKVLLWEVATGATKLPVAE